MPTFKIPQEIQELSEPDLDDKEKALLGVDLESLAQQYITLDDEEKALKKKKDDAKKKLLEQIQDYVALSGQIELKTETVVASLEELERFKGDFTRWVSFYYPAYIVESATPTPEGGWELVLSEDPSYVKYTVVVGDRQVGRTLRMEGAELDIDGLFADPDLESLTEEAEEAFAGCFKKKVITTWEIDEDAIVQAVGDYPEIMPIIKRYSYAGSPKVVMTPVAKAKEIDV